MKRDNKIAYILIFIFLIALIICIIILNKNNKDITINNGDTLVNNDITINGSDFKLLNNQNIFFSLQNSINDYYENLDNEEYINNIVIDEKEKLNKLDNLTYIMNKAYYLDIDDTTFYVVSGKVIKESYVNGDNSYNTGIYFIYVYNNTIRLKRLNASNIDVFLNKLYYQGNIDLKEGISYEVNTISIENKLTYYLGNFMNNLMYYPKDAYSLLDNNMKKFYSSYNIFLSDVMKVYNKITPVIFSYSSISKSDYMVYNVVDDKQNNIVITEYGIMDYKIFIDIY